MAVGFNQKVDVYKSLHEVAVVKPPSNLGVDPKGASAPLVIAKTIRVHLAFFAFSWSSGPPKEFGSFCEIRFPVLLDPGIF